VIFGKIFVRPPSPQLFLSPYELRPKIIILGYKIFTQPKLSTRVSKSINIKIPIQIEIYFSIYSSLKYLENISPGKCTEHLVLIPQSL